MPTKENKFIPNLDEVYEDLSLVLRRMNRGAEDEDLIDFESISGFIMKAFPGSHYKCEMKEDSYFEIEDVIFYFDTPTPEQTIKVVFPAEC